MSTLNAAFSELSARRRYEVWFIRMGLADGSGALWIRYLLLNPGRSEGRGEDPLHGPVQIWATWFPYNGKPISLIRGLPVDSFMVSPKDAESFYFRTEAGELEESRCHGALQLDGHCLSWNLRYRSSFAVTLSDKGWIGFSRTPHSDAIFSGEVVFDGRRMAGEPLGFGLQGHNCGYRHRKFWTWTHAYFHRAEQPASTLEALTYEMPFGFVFRKAVLWHDGVQRVFKKFQESSDAGQDMQWRFDCAGDDGTEINVAIDGRGSSLHSLPYQKTDGRGRFEVRNNSLAVASLVLHRPDGSTETLYTSSGAVLEVVR